MLSVFRFTALTLDSCHLDWAEGNPSCGEVVVLSAYFCHLLCVSFHSFVEVNLLIHGLLSIILFSPFYVES